MQHVTGTIQHYDWGDLTAIAHLLGHEPDGRPQAELWFGTHSGAPSHIGDGHLLQSVVGELPYLLKVLAAARPLSLQVHPSADQARRGFEHENELGIPLDAPQRTYRDPFHKPEILCALTRFEAMCGFTTLEQTNELLADLGHAAEQIATIVNHAGIDGLIALLLHDRPPLAALLDAAAHHDDPRCQWLIKLSQLHPGDASAALVLLMNHVELQPGEALFLGAGTLHAYLGGFGVEVMAGSDNVVRCGLTSKHVDVDEVLRVVDTTPLVDPVVRPTATADGGARYEVPVTDFRVIRYDIDGSVSFTADGPELLLCTDGETVEVSQGECLVAADGEDVELVGTATVFRVGRGDTY